MDKNVDIEELAAAIGQLTNTLEDILKFGNLAVEESTIDFVNSKIGKLFGMAAAYVTCFKRIGVSTKEEMETNIHKYARHARLRETSTELLDMEQEWDSFLSDIDKTLEGDVSDAVQVGETGPVSIPVVEARSNQETSLKDFLAGGPLSRNERGCFISKDAITSAGGAVIIISFGQPEGAGKWLSDTGCPFPMLLDSDRKIYHTFGLQRSTLKVWGVASMVYYAEAMYVGKPLPKPYENVHDDPQQMGGDFIIDSEGTVRFLYPSKTNADRPSVDLLLNQLKKIQSA